VTTRSRGPSAGFEWLKRGIGLAFRHPKPLFGGAALLLVTLVLPSLISMSAQFLSHSAGAPPSPAMLAGVMVVSMLIGLLIVPLYAGYLQVIDAAERGQPANGFGIFRPYAQGEALRLIGFGLVLILIYVVMLGIVIVAAGSGLVGWYMQVLAAQANHQLPPGLPQGFGIAMALFTVMGLFMMGFYSIALGQIALRRRGVFNAIGDGLLGALKNLLPLIVLTLTLIVAWIVAVIGIVIVGVVLALIGKLVGAWLSLALLIPLYIAMMLLVVAVMFGVMYYLWRDVCAGDSESGVAQAIAA